MLHLWCEKLNKRCGAYLSKYGMHSQLDMVISVSHYPFVSVNYPCSYECYFEAVAKEIQAWPLQCQNRIKIFLLHGCFGNDEKSLTTILNCTTLANKIYLINHVMIFESMDLHSFSAPNWEVSCKKPKILTERLNVSLLCSLRWVDAYFFQCYSRVRMGHGKPGKS